VKEVGQGKCRVIGVTREWSEFQEDGRSRERLSGVTRGPAGLQEDREKLPEGGRSLREWAEL
jgi:hypothetical protein